MTGESNGVGWWKATALFLAGVVIAGVPSAFSSLTGPSSEDVQRVREQVIMTQVQLASVQTQLESITSEQMQAQEQLDELRRIIIARTP